MYSRDHDGWQPSSLPVKATGILNNFPIPVVFSVEYDERGDDSDSLH